MIELFRQQLNKAATENEKINLLRELLQITVLKIIYDKGYFNNIAFVGGTALRILFGLKRFSEDLDFSLIHKKIFLFVDFNTVIERELEHFGLNVTIKSQKSKAVESSFLKFTGLLKELGLSQLKEQKLSIKVEIDTNPPAGWKIEKTLINKLYIFNIVHYDIPSLYATKLHACFFRKFIKGRDFYDLVWYISRKTKPNFTLLNNCIRQTEGYNPKISDANFRQFLKDKLSRVDFVKVKRDVERFLEDPNEVKLLNAKTIIGSI